jgi:hypothetical protein
VRELSRRLLSREAPVTREPLLSFGSWDGFPTLEFPVLQVCHPDWRGVRTATYAFRSPVVECDDLERWGEELIEGIRSARVGLVVVQGWPPGSASFVRRIRREGIPVKAVLHSSPAQHGAEAGEAVVASEVLDLARTGVIREVAFVKVGVAQSLRHLGYPAVHLPNRVPDLPALEPVDLAPGLHVGVFAEPFWRKNVVTQLLAAGLLEGAVAHVIRRPEVVYLDGLHLVEHGELPREVFLRLQGSMDLNLYVSLSECHPLTPMESYLAGVPCLTSRTSEVFASDPVLWELTSVDRTDDPAAIASAALRLVGRRAEAVERARRWMVAADAAAASAWDAFTRS